MNRRVSLLILLALVAAMIVPAAVSAEVIVTDGPRPEGRVYSHRLIVELASPPLAQASVEVRAAAVGDGKLDVASPAAQAYIQRLQAEQQQFMAAMQAAIPNARVATFINERGARVPVTYQVLLNGMAVDAGRDVNLEALERQLLQLPNVRRVSKDYAQSPDLYKSIELINAPAAWALVGGEDNAGEGMKVASVDGGLHPDAPMFSGAGYTYPPGYPKGDPRGTNGKIIVARTYFRTWDPPALDDDEPWPGASGISHGVHTTSIAAGNRVEVSFLGAPPVVLRGVAPRAYVMSYRVFYNSITGNTSFYNAEGIRALEDAVADGADVINNSWGAGPYTLGGTFDALDAALLNAVQANVFVSMSAGNAGPGGGTTDHPSQDYIIAAASTSGGSYAAGVLEATAPAPVPPDLTGLPYQAAAFGQPIPLGVVLGPFPYAAAGVVAPGNDAGCNPFPAGAFAGKVALIIRGGCEFGVKALNAQNAGATMFVVYNSQVGGDDLLSMGPGAVGSQVTIPGVFIGYSNGTRLLQWNEQHPDTAQLQLSTIAFQVGNQPDVLAAFSSRGPSVGSGLKPDITAPGVNILAQGYAPDKQGEERHLGFGQASGTSMAAPHVAGAATLLKQIHPTWSPGWVKSALMSTSKYLDIYTHDGRPAQPLDMGAGRLDLTHAADPGVILDPPSLGFSRVTLGETKTMTLTVISVASATETYALSTLDTRQGFTQTTTLAGVTVNPTTLTLAPNQSAQVTVTWDTTAAGEPGDEQGFVLLDGPMHDAHFPIWLRVGYPADPNVGRVLLIDNDGSSSLGGADFPDFTPYYTDTLDNLGISYDVWDADDRAGQTQTLPDANYLAQYEAVIYQTGNWYFPTGSFTVPTPLTQFDMDALTEYANEGGSIIAFGQDLSSVAQGTAANPSFFFQVTLGAEFLQDTINDEEVFDDAAQLLIGVPQSPYRHMNFDISDRGDGAGNQFYIDELGPGCYDPDTREACPNTIPLLQYGVRGNDVQDGFVAIATTERLSLERPGVISRNKTMIFGFGLEGVNNDTGFNTREDLLGTALNWSWDRPTATIQVTPGAPGSVTRFTVEMESEFGGDVVSFRWDFGDGSGFTPPYTSEMVGHVYERAGRYLVRVEATNELGTTVIAERWITIGWLQYLPMIFR